MVDAGSIIRALLASGVEGGDNPLLQRPFSQPCENPLLEKGRICRPHKPTPCAA